MTASEKTVDITSDPGRQSAARRGTRIRNLITSRATVLVVSALALILYFDSASGGLFITTTNASLLLRQTAVIAVIAAGVAVLIIMGEIDLSIGSAVFLTGLVAAQCQVAGWDLISTILAAVAAGVGIGLLQGLVIVRFGVPAFVVTLAGLLLWRGIGLMWTNAVAVGPVSTGLTALTEAEMPMAVGVLLAALTCSAGVVKAVTMLRHNRSTGASSLATALAPAVVSTLAAAVLLWVTFGKLGLPNALLWIAVVGVVLTVVMTRAKFGRRAFLVGSNREAATYSGISTGRTVLAGFLLMGAIYGIAGVMLTARLSTSTADSGLNLELVAIAAAVIGGNSLRGGVGSIQGAILGAFLLATIDNGMSLLGVSSYAQNVVKGLILVLAVGIDGYLTRRQTGR
ncbi:MAG: sugar ABC transporter permease [Rhodococcus sp. (in: high G+C Gram-positive bacteria)]